MRYQKHTIVSCLFVLSAAASIVGAESNRSEIALTPRHGPWLIYVTSFRGPTAKEKAENLARRLRESQKLTAYTHSISDQKRREEHIRQARYREENPRFRAPKIRIHEEYAVLVGDYRSRESALRSLERMKNQNSSWLSLPFKWFRKGEEDSPHPLARGFVVPNPTAPKEEKTFRIWD